MAVVVFKEIKPKRFNNKAFVAELRAGMDKTGKEIKAEYQKTTRTWRHKPDFEIISDIGPKGPEVLVGTDDEIYGYVDRGTKVRYATMTPDFIPKTTRGVIGSKGGRGGVAFINKQRPRPGIKSRNFTITIQKKSLPRFKRTMEEKMKRARQKSGHAI